MTDLRACRRCGHAETEHDDDDGGEQCSVGRDLFDPRERCICMFYEPPV